MAIRTVFDVESSERPQRRALSNVARFVLVAGPFRWLIANRAVAPGEPWRRACDECGTPLWPAACGPSGRCATCRHRVGAPPYLIEALVVAAIGLVALSPLFRPAAAVWLACAIALATIDGLVHRLPLPVVAAMSAGTAALLVIPAALDDRWDDLIRAGAAGAALSAVLFLLCLPRNGLGLGDAALAFPIGLVLGWFGWPTVVAWALLTSLLVGLTGITLLAVGRATRQSRIPLGPFMLLAAVLAVAVS